MRSVLVFDSQYGNTEKIARSIADAIKAQGEITLLRVGEASLDELAGFDLLIVGSPTQQFKPTAAIKTFLKGIPGKALSGAGVAAFDTRLTQANIDSTPVLPHFVKIFGYAAGKIAQELQKKGGRLVIPAEGFYVEGMEGPLVAGELERAAGWALRLVSKQ